MRNNLLSSIVIDEEKANLLVKKSLIEIGYREDLKIKRYILDDGAISYSIYNPIIYDGKETFTLTEINFFDYMNLLKQTLDKSEDSYYQIFPIVKKDKISYKINTNGKNKVYRKN